MSKSPRRKKIKWRKWRQRHPDKFLQWEARLWLKMDELLREEYGDSVDDRYVGRWDFPVMTPMSPFVVLSND